MVKRKLSFDVDEDKIAAIAAYVCNHVSSITFIGKNGRVEIKSATMDNGTVRLSPTDKTCWSVKGHVRLEYEKGDGFLTQTFLCSSDCQLNKGKNEEPVVSNLTCVQISDAL